MLENKKFVSYISCRYIILFPDYVNRYRHDKEPPEGDYRIRESYSVTHSL